MESFKMSNKVEFIKKVAEIQKQLKAPKSQYNSFGKYKYRSCEDILEGVKHLLGDMVLTICDDITLVSDRVYVKATATITDGENEISNSAFARESLNKKGQDESQITGTASSYARKYALNGLLCIDDTRDADSFAPVVNHVAKPDETAQSWVNAIKSGSTNIEEIKDIKYRNYIKGLL
jgi:hypothetical protein